MDSYTLKSHKVTGEFHLFQGVFTPADKKHACNTGDLSICRMMERLDTRKNIFACIDEAAARAECAALGRLVCGVCVSNLYADF
jgi:hypothetical protein